MVTREYGSCECTQTREYIARKYLRVASETLHLSGTVLFLPKLPKMFTHYSYFIFILLCQ